MAHIERQDAVRILREVRHRVNSAYGCSSLDLRSWAQEFGVPIALIELASEGVTANEIDALLAWWPRKEA